ncbi:MAG: stage III sporulation protein AB [Oscillospiraceae bacterium]|nr:stage III sporulation protein AB [Oscillospiraceae bacterium]
MLRWLGACLILCGALLTRRELLAARRRAQRMRLELAEAFEAMSSEIRLLLTPLPELFRRSRAPDTKPFFEETAKALANGQTLECAWEDAANALPLPEEERTGLAAIGSRLCGGEDGVCAALTLAASNLRRTYEQNESKRGEDERLTTSICVSVGLFLTILLL